MMSQIVFVLATVVHLFFVGVGPGICKFASPPVFVGSDEYSRVEASLNLNEEEARNIADQFHAAQGGQVRLRHYFIFANNYVFSTRREKLGIPLSGYYVNGYTGDVVALNSRDGVESMYCGQFPIGFIKYGQAREIGYTGEWK